MVPMCSNMSEVEFQFSNCCMTVVGVQSGMWDEIQMYQMYTVKNYHSHLLERMMLAKVLGRYPQPS